VMAAILARDDLGASATGPDATALATALAAIVDRPAGARAAMRDRCRRVTRERYNWETTVEPYLALVGRLVASPG
jgi:glycosyltransferase involved in cell wall biosynthesis